MKKVISLLLSAAMVCGTFSALAVNASAEEPELKSVSFKSGASYTNVETEASATFNGMKDVWLYGSSVGQYYWTRANDWNAQIGYTSGKPAADRVIYRADISNTGLSTKKIDHGEFKVTVRTSTGNQANKKYSLYKVTDADGDWNASESSTNTAYTGMASYAQKKRHGYARTLTLSNGTSIDTNNTSFKAYLEDSSLWGEDKTQYDTSKLGTYWAGGDGLGEPGGGSYEALPVSTVTIDTSSATDTEPKKFGTLTFNIDGETLTEWANGKNNGFIIRADDETESAYITVCMSNNNDKYNPSSTRENYPELTVYYSDAVKLDAPANVEIAGGVVTWDAVTNASGYKVQLYKDGTVFGNAVTVNTNEYEIPADRITETGVYQAKVTAVGEGVYLDSDESALTTTFYYYVEDGQYSFFYGNGYTGTSDTVLRSSIGQYYATNGIDWIISIGKTSNELYRAIARFNLSSLKEQNVNIGDGKLTYRIYTAPSQETTFDLYKITDKDGDWSASSSKSNATYQAGKASYAQKIRHGYTFTSNITMIGGTYDGSAYNSNHKNLREYLDNPTLLKAQTSWYDEAKSTGVYWAGGDGMGEPGGGSYEAAPVASATIDSNSTVLEFTIPADTIKEWEEAGNNGFLIRARDESVNSAVRIYAANDGGSATQATYPRLVVSEYKEPEEKVEVTSLSVTSDGASVSAVTSAISSLDVSAAVKNDTKSEISPVFIIALYSSDGTLKGTEIKTADAAIAANGGTANITGRFAPASGFSAGDTVKFMLWDSAVGMNPYTTVKTLADANK